MSGPTGSVWKRPSGWQALGLFWAAIAVAILVLAGVLEYLGPADIPPDTGGRATNQVAGIRPPDPGLLEPYQADPGHWLPRIGADGRTARAAYAAPFSAPAGAPRVGLILAGFGLDRAGSEDALKTLPAAVTLALSPYARGLDTLLPQLRAMKHEYLMAIPMEPSQGELNDAGGRALLTSLTWPDNLERLEWALSRAQGYVGVTDALGRLRGRRFTAEPEEMAALFGALRERGLLYVGALPQATGQPGPWERGIDLVVDDQEDAAAIDARLAELTALARRHGNALGLAGAVRPVTVARIQAWASGLAAQGVVLAPASALVARSAGRPAAR